MLEITVKHVESGETATFRGSIYLAQACSFADHWFELHLLSGILSGPAAAKLAQRFEQIRQLDNASRIAARAQERKGGAPCPTAS